jgi:hypothetical protein
MFSGRRNTPATRAAVAGALSVGAGVLGFGSVASAAEPTQQEMLEQIKALQAKVEQLERQSQQAPQTQAAQPQATTQPSAEAATVDSVLRDAERRSKPALFQAGGFTAGYSKNKFLIQDEAGDFVLNPNLQFQVRYVANQREDDLDDDDESRTESGFEIRRMKFAFDGNVFGPGLTYKFQWATNRANGQPILDDAWVRWAMGDAFGEMSKDFALRIGQFKDPTFHEEITSSKRQLAVDRSLANELLAGGITDWIQGVSLIWDDGPEGRPLRGEIGYSDGFNSDNTNFVDGGGSAFYGAANPDWGAFARVELLAMGNWKQYDDFTAMGNEGTGGLLVVGAGATYTENGETTGGGDTLLYTIDVQYEVGPLGLYAAYIGAYSEPGIDPDPDDDTIDAAAGIHDMGFLAQAGYLVSKKCELFGRYDVVFLDDARFNPAADTDDNFHELTVGMNYYIKGHAAKFTIDGSWLPNGSPSAQDGIGILQSGDDDQFLLRTQFQLLI